MKGGRREGEGPEGGGVGSNPAVFISLVSFCLFVVGMGMFCMMR